MRPAAGLTRLQFRLWITADSAVKLLTKDEARHIDVANLPALLIGQLLKLNFALDSNFLPARSHQFNS
jgi:hypothetical protein